MRSRDDDYIVLRNQWLVESLDRYYVQHNQWLVESLNKYITVFTTQSVIGWLSVKLILDKPDTIENLNENNRCILLIGRIDLVVIKARQLAIDRKM